ncbi:MAG: RNA-directed DNA polymerase [Symploca sp. SIO2E9]|nr:RNA-directed DNA polymerase [Symploca sp. SIO2E9]
MSSGNQFEDFLTPENFHLAFSRLQTASRNLYKELYYEDLKIFGLFLDQNIEFILDEIKQGIFKSESSYKIFIPKKNNLVRPLSLLKFKDLLVYQAITNTIADYLYDEITPYYNHIIFGNVYNTSKESEKNRIFFFKPWKQQWKKFEEKSKKYYESGYRFLSEFDIASFFDTIDHYILQQILEKNYKIDQRLSKILLDLLEAGTSDFSSNTFRSKHGIPQGPIASSFLADLYLFYLDEQITSRKLDIQYIRYVDDIRIFSKDKFTAQQAICYLDLIARDLGLIPQASKILISEINNVDSLLKKQKNKFSLIAKEYKKKEGSLKAKTHRKLKDRFLSCFDENSEEYLDKTLIRFSLYKLNKDEEIKSVILKKCKDLYIHFEAILFYLQKHFSEDKEVKTWLINILKNKNLLFHHIVALIFKFFPELEFIEDVYIKYMLNQDRHWLVKYFMIHWLYKNNKFEIIFNFKSDNYFLNREANSFKYKIIKDKTYKKQFISSLLEDKDCLIALQGIKLNPFIFRFIADEYNQINTSKYNRYVSHIISGDKIDYIQYTLKEEFSILAPDSFFNNKIWNDIHIYKELMLSFRLFFQNRTIDPSKSLLSLNGFNNLVFDKICEMLEIANFCKDKEYGVNLNSGCIQDCFPLTNRFFSEINKQRNEKTDAHPYNKSGNIRDRINGYEMEKLISKQKKALKEICEFNFIKYPSIELKG